MRLSVNDWIRSGICEIDSRACEMIIRSSWPFVKHLPDTLSFQALSK